MIDLTKLVIVIVGVLFAILTTKIIPYMNHKLSAAQIAEIKLWVDIAVYAAEMLFTGSGRGEEKKEYVVKFLESKGFTIDIESIDAMIEASVLALKKAA